ncbi:hypothetical protein APA_3161 [Pseudanabaena sp. lw0831]|nr:hypothetical protein APA_3161 [Pseudanabaena sp. lw0831]
MLIFTNSIDCYKDSDRDILLHNALHLLQSTQTKCKVFNSDIATLNELKESQPAGTPS